MSFIKRNICHALLEVASYYPVVSLIGPRQSGKTTIVRHLFKDKPYVSLENPDSRQFAELDPRGFLEQYPDGAILDEIQRLPVLLSYIQGIVDERNQKGQFILTGSHQLQLQQSISQSLAGRTALLKLLPLSLSELPKQYQHKSIDYYLYQGMYPRVINDAINPTVFYKNYFQTYVERDVRQMINIKDLSLFQKFMQLCASRIGQVFNASSVANEVGSTSKTVESWLSILEASFIIFRLQPYYENFGKRVIKSPKLYFTDVGLACYCLDIYKQTQVARDPLRGNLVENFIIAEIAKAQMHLGLEPSLYYYRDSNQKEVDLIMKSGSQLLPIEIKSSKTFNKAFLKGLNYFQSIAKEKVDKGYLIYAGEHQQRIDNWQVINFHQLVDLPEIVRG